MEQYNTLGQESIYVNKIQFFMDFAFLNFVFLVRKSKLVILQDFTKIEFVDKKSIFTPVCTSRFGSLDMCACAIFLRKEF